MFRIIVSIMLIAHGIGHIIGISAAWTPVKMGFSDHPWIFSNGVNITSGIGRAFGIVWLTALIISIMAGFGLLFRMDWWTSLAIVGAIISAIALVIWFPAFPSGSNISALVLDLLIIAVLMGPWSNKVIEFLH
jgi:hypothetical protein